MQFAITYLQIAFRINALARFKHLLTDFSLQIIFPAVSLPIVELLFKWTTNIKQFEMESDLHLLWSALNRSIGYYLINTYIQIHTYLIVIISYSYLKMVDAFMLISTVFAFMALIEYCLVTIVLDEFGTRKCREKKCVIGQVQGLTWLSLNIEHRLI